MLKGIKVCLAEDRNCRKGIAAASLEDLKRKISLKFEVSSFEYKRS